MNSIEVKTNGDNIFENLYKPDIKINNYMFENDYPRFVKYNTTLKVKKYFEEKGVNPFNFILETFGFTNELELLFCGFIENKIKIYLIMVLDGKNKNILLFFGNIAKNRSPYKIKVFKNNSGYWCFNTTQLQNLPRRYQNILKERGVPKNSKKNTTTTLQRLVTASLFNLSKKDVHHIDERVENNDIQNLIPLSKKFHDEKIHQDFKMQNIKISFKNHRKKYIKDIHSFKKNKSSTKNYRRTVILCKMRYIDKVPITKISKDVELNRRWGLSKRSLENVIYKYAEFEEFYHLYIKPHLKK